MDVFQGALLVGAIGTAALCRKDRRALGWIAAGAANFVITAAYQDAGLPHHPVFTAFADASVCLAIYFFGRYRWEMRLWNVFQMSVLISIMRFVGTIARPEWVPYFPSNYTYIALLEACNWAALAVIGGTRIMQMVDNHALERHPRGALGRVHRLVRSLRAERKAPPFHIF